MFRRRTAAVFFAAAYMFSAFGSLSGEAAAEDPQPDGDPNPGYELPSTESPASGDPVVEAWTARSRTYETDVPGVYRTELYSAPVNYRDGGTWAEIDSTLEPAGSTAYVNAANSIDVTIASDAGADQLAGLEVSDGSGVSFSLEDAASSPVDVSENVATFDDVVEGTDLQLESIPAGIKETILVEGPDSPTTYRFPLAVSGLTGAVAADGSVEFSDASDEVRLVVPPGFMDDSAVPSNTSYGVTYALVDDGSTLEVSLDEAWLNDPSRQFPVMVDPSLLIYSSTDDTYVNSASSGNFAASTVLKVGQGPTNRNRAFLHFNTDSLDGMNVHDAALNIWQASSSSCTATPVDIYPITGGWTGGSTSSWPGPPVDTADLAGTISSGKGGSSSCPANVVSAPIAGLVRDWASEARPNYGLSLRARSETSASQYKEFASANSFVVPSLSVTWSDPYVSGTPDDPTNVRSGTVLTGTPQLWADYSDPESDSGSILFTIRDTATDGVIASQFSSTVSSGSTATVTLGTALPMDVPLTIEAHAFDASQHASFGTSEDLIRSRVSVSAATDLDTDPTPSPIALSATLQPGLTASQIEFLVDGNVVGTDSSSPYAYSWSSGSTADGNHVLTARATTSGGTYTSPADEITLVGGSFDDIYPGPPGDGGVAPQSGMVTSSEAERVATEFFGDVLLGYLPIDPVQSKMESGTTDYLYQVDETEDDLEVSIPRDPTAESALTVQGEGSMAVTPFDSGTATTDGLRSDGDAITYANTGTEVDTVITPQDDFSVDVSHVLRTDSADTTIDMSVEAVTGYELVAVDDRTLSFQETTATGIDPWMYASLNVALDSAGQAVPAELSVGTAGNDFSVVVDTTDPGIEFPGLASVNIGTMNAEGSPYPYPPWWDRVGVTQAELNYCLSVIHPTHFRRCMIALDYSRSANKAAANIDESDGPPSTLHNGRTDAFRHCYWSAQLQQHFGWDSARGFTDRHEQNPNQPRMERRMDQRNNRKGRVVGQNTGLNRLAALLDCSNMMGTHDLWVLSPQGGPPWRLVHSS